MLKNILRLLAFSFVLAPLAVFASSPSVSIGSLSPGTTVNSGNAVYFTAVPSNFNGSVTYSLSDSISSSITNSNINSGGVFAWIPSASDSGTHNITVTVTDGAANSASATITIVVQGPPTVTIQNLSPGSSVNVGQTVFWSSNAANVSNPIFYVNDSQVSSITSNNINASGGFSWTPQNQDVGSHTITVTVSDGSGRTASASQSITVGIATATVSSLTPGDSVVAKQNVKFNVVPTGFTNPVYTASDSFYGSTVQPGSVDSTGLFSWTPQAQDLGVHIISINVSDSSGNKATASQKITVSSAAMSIKSISPGSVISAGTAFSFFATTTGFVNPTYTVFDSFSGSSVTNANITSSGAFAWIPQGSDVGSHNINVRAIDSYGNSSSASITVVVNSASGQASGSQMSGTSQSSSGSSVKYVFNNYLAVGSTGPGVTALQNLLIAKGFLSGTPTGYFGLLTAAAVKKFQTVNNISAVGFVGPGTRAVLNGLSVGSSGNSGTSASANASYKFTLSLGLGSSGSEVTALQNKLTALGLYSGPITGTFGPLTSAAVVKFQAKYGLSQVGVIGPATRAVLNGL